MERLEIFSEKLHESCLTKKTRCVRSIQSFGILIHFNAKGYEISYIIVMFSLIIHFPSI